MIKLSNIIIDENIISTVEPIEVNSTPLIHITTNTNKLCIAIYEEVETRNQAITNLAKFLKITCCWWKSYYIYLGQY